MHDLRRESPRIDVEALCWELVDGREAIGLAVDLSTMGIRVERPYIGGPTRREVPLELEVPGFDEVIWAKGSACFDLVVPSSSPTAGPLGLLRRTGYRLAAAAARDLRMIQEYVVETHRARLAERALELWAATCYTRA